MNRFENPQEYPGNPSEHERPKTEQETPPKDAELEAEKERVKRQKEMASFDKDPGSKRSPLERAEKYIRMILAGAMLVCEGGILYESHREKVEERDTTEYLSKNEFLEKAANSGFDLEINVPNGDGPYIVHIGYIHSFRGTPTNSQAEGSIELMNFLNHDDIVKGNISAEQLLLSLKEKGSTPSVVFTEGFDDQSEGFLEFMASQRDEVVSIETNEKTVDRLAEFISLLPSKEELPKRARISFEYLVSQKLAELSKSSIHITSDKLSVLKNVCEKKLGSFDMQTINERMLIEGAAMKTFIDGEYRIAPAESSIIRDRIVKGENTLSQIAEKMAQLNPKSSEENREQFNELLTQYNNTRALLHRIETIDSRENFAVELISSVVLEQKVDHGVILMLYGVSHDFSDNVRNLNRSGGKEKIGLITFVPKVYEGPRDLSNENQ